MREILSTVDTWLAEGKRVAIARVIGVEQSGPRDPGATMAVNEDGEVAGRCRGVVLKGRWSLKRSTCSRQGSRDVAVFGYSDDQAFAVGLTCGGTVHLLVEPLDW